MLVLGVQRSESVIYIQLLFQIFFPYELSQNIECISLSNSRSLLPILCSSVYMPIPTSQFIPPSNVSPLVTISLKCAECPLECWLLGLDTSLQGDEHMQRSGGDHCSVLFPSTATGQAQVQVILQATAGTTLD